MSTASTSWTQTILDSYQAFWWQLYLGSLLLGFSSGFGTAIWRHGRKLQTKYAALVRFLLYAAALANLAVIGLTITQHYSSSWTSIFDLADHFFDFIVDGALLGALLAILLHARTSLSNDGSLFGTLLKPETMRAAKCAIAALYVAAGVTKFLAHEPIDFFHASGYSTTFFYFIATWEFVWGIGVLWRRTLKLALVALSIEMLGAVYTHYHNYFTRGFAGPFGNSVDALRMLGLMAYIGLALSQKGQHESRTQISKLNITP